MESHVKVLAALHIVLGALGVVAALGLTLLIGSTAGLLRMAADSAEALIALPIIGIAGGAVVLFLLFLSLPGIVAGLGLLNFRPWARILALVLSAVNLLNVPLGTILGGYGLWVLLSPETERLFSRAPAVATGPDATSDLDSP